MKAYPLNVREQVVAAYDQGMTQSEVAERFGISSQTVRSYVKLRQTTGEIVPRRHCCAARKVLSAGDVAVLRQLRAEDPKASLPVLAERLAERCGVRASASTIRSRLVSMGISYVRHAPKRIDPRPREPLAKPYAFVPTPAPPTSSGRKPYPTDLSDAEWEILEPLIPKCKPGGRPEEWPRRELVNAMLYVLRNGNTWRSLPHDFPPWSTVYGYFRKWRISGLWARINDELRSKVRQRGGRAPSPSAAIMDSQSAHTTEKGGLMAGMATSA